MECANNSDKSLGKRELDTPRLDRDLESAILEEAARDGKMLVTGKPHSYASLRG
jgi:hypothetical protein